jgi:nicotinamidase-related amidase
MELDASLLAPERVALIVVDLQNDYCAPDGHLARHGRDVAPIRAILPRTRLLLDLARRAGVLVVFTLQTAHPGGLSDSPARAHFKQKAKPGLGTAYPLAGSSGHAIVAALGPQPEDLLLPKCRSSAFVATPLDMILRANRRDVLLICGAVTEGCVESTMRGAADHDYIPILIDDCVASPQAELHQAALTVMRGRYDSCASEILLARWSATAGRGVGASS